MCQIESSLKFQEDKWSHISFPLRMEYQESSQQRYGFNNLYNENQLKEPHPDDEDFFSKMYVYDSETNAEIQEIRQRVRNGETGVVTETVTRIIGDKLYSYSRQIFEDGHSLSKESWRNVSVDETESFKKQWAQLKKRLCPGVRHEDSLESFHEKMPIPLQ